MLSIKAQQALVDMPMKSTAFKYDKLSRTVTNTFGEEYCLSPQCGSLLELLLDVEGEVVTRDQMRDRIWGHSVVSEDTINHLICRLRKELNSHDENAICKIEAISKVGYRLVIREEEHGIKHHVKRWIAWTHGMIKPPFR